jgi:hypothetical protein
VGLGPGLDFKGRRFAGKSICRSSLVRLDSPRAGSNTRGIHFVDLLLPLSPASGNPGAFCFPQRGAAVNGIPGPLIFGLHLA